MQSSAQATTLSRRRLLALGGAAATVAVTGCSNPFGGPGGAESGGAEPGGYESAECVPRDTLESHRSLAGAPLVYEPTGRQATFWFDPGFLTQLETWAASLGQAPAQWRTYGSWTDGGSACDSWHNSGRAFDLASLRLDGGKTVSCRYDQWQSSAPAALAQSRRAYWILASGLHRHFAYVLTYLYDSAHANHIHVDNGRSGSELSTLSTRSRVQVQAVQAITSYLWDDPVELTGRWDSATRAASGRVLERLGGSGDLDDNVENWRAFLDASAALPRD